MRSLPRRCIGASGRQDVRAIALRLLAGLNPLQMLQHRPVLLGRVVDPDREHPVHHLVVARVLDLGEPPDAPLRDAADPELPVRGERLVLRRVVDALVRAPHRQQVPARKRD